MRMEINELFNSLEVLLGEKVGEAFGLLREVEGS